MKRFFILIICIVALVFAVKYYIDYHTSILFFNEEPYVNMKMNGEVLIIPMFEIIIDNELVRGDNDE